MVLNLIVNYYIKEWEFGDNVGTWDDAIEPFLSRSIVDYAWVDDAGW